MLLRVNRVMDLTLRLALRDARLDLFQGGWSLEIVRDSRAFEESTSGCVSLDH